MEKTGFSRLAHFVRKKRYSSYSNLHERFDKEFIFSSHFESHHSLAVSLIKEDVLFMFFALTLTLIPIRTSLDHICQLHYCVHLLSSVPSPFSMH